MLRTLKYVKTLEQAGISRDQAEAHVQIISEIVEEGLATKQDIKDIKDEMQKMEYRLVIKLGTIVSISLAGMATLATIAVKVL